MKLLVMIVRTLMGLLFVFGGVVVLFNLMPQPEMSGNVKVFMEGIIATGYLLPLIKITELVCGLAFIMGRFVPLASIVISPVIVNIFFFHLFVDTSGLLIAALLVCANVLVAASNWEAYRPLFKARGVVTS